MTYTEMAAALVALRSENYYLKRQVTKLNRLALTDPLTGLGNRSAFKESMSNHISEYRRAVHGGNDSEMQMKAFTVVALDNNGLKHVNDTAGQEAGDKMISIVSAAIKGTVRGFESAYRLGGDELAIILTDTPDVAKFAGRFESKLDELTHAAGFWHKITVALGHASIVELPAEKSVSCPEEETIAAISHLADTRMYENKREMKDAMRRARR